MTLAECKTQCLLTAACTGVTWAPAGGDCCLRADIVTSQCEADGEWNTYKLTRAAGSGDCWRLSAVDIASCDTEGELYDTYLSNEPQKDPWWLTTNFVERTLMPRRYICRANSGETCSFRDLRDMLPALQRQGYTVLNVDWPVHAGPDDLFLGFGILDPYAVDPLLGTDADWASLVAEAHRRSMKVVADFNPSYWWTGAPAFKQAERDVRNHGVNRLPASSPARWFRWTKRCPGALQKPPDDYDDLNGYTDGWVYSPAASACYWAKWGGSDNNIYGGQPTADLSSPEWRAELTRVFTHWAVERRLDGFVLDAPPDYLAVPHGLISELNHQLIASLVRSVIVEPMHALGAAVFAEMYNLQVPTITKMIDGGRNTDMGGHGNQVVKGFPSLLADMVTSEDASGLEDLLQRTVDVYNGWCGTARTQPHSRGPARVAGIKAATTALLAGYYVMRMGPNCESPYGRGYGPSPKGNEWPGGCPGDWAGASEVASTLKALPKSSALRPGAPRRAFRLAGSTSTYAALRTSSSDADAAIILLNFANAPAPVTLGDELSQFGVVRPQTPTDLIEGGAGPRIRSNRPWTVTLPARGWAVYAVAMR